MYLLQMSGDPGLTQPTSDPNFVDSSNVQMNGSAAMPAYDEFGNAITNDNMVSPLNKNVCPSL